MKKQLKAILILFCLMLGMVSFQEAQAQYKKKRPKSARFKTPYSFGKAQHTSGMKGLELGLGASKNGYFQQLELHYFLSNKWQTQITGRYEKGDLKGTAFESFYVDFGTTYTFFHINDKFYFNGLGGASAVWDQLPAGTLNRLEEGNVNATAPGMGMFLGFGTEWFFHHQWALVLKGQQHYYFNHTFGHQRFFASAGLKFSF